MNRQKEQIMARCILVAAVSVFGMSGSPVAAATITSPNQLSSSYSLIDFETVPTGTDPLVIDGVTFTSLTGSLSIFDVSAWPSNGTEIASKTLFPGAEPDSAISIEFAEPVSEVLVGWGDANFTGNVLQAFDADGDLLEEAHVTLAAPGGGHAAWIGFKRATADIKRVIVQPDQSQSSGDDYVIDNIHYGRAPAPKRASWQALRSEANFLKAAKTVAVEGFEDFVQDWCVAGAAWPSPATPAAASTAR